MNYQRLLSLPLCYIFLICIELSLYKFGWFLLHSLKALRKIERACSVYTAYFLINILTHTNIFKSLHFRKHFYNKNKIKKIVTENKGLLIRKTKSDYTIGMDTPFYSIYILNYFISLVYTTLFDKANYG